MSSSAEEGIRQKSLTVTQFPEVPWLTGSTPPKRPRPGPGPGPGSDSAKTDKLKDRQWEPRGSGARFKIARAFSL